MRISDWSSDVCSSDLSKALDEAEAKTKEPAANGDAEESEEGEPVKPAKADKADKDAKDETEGDEGEQDEEGDEQAAQPKDAKPKKPQRPTIPPPEKFQDAAKEQLPSVHHVVRADIDSSEERRVGKEGVGKVRSR